jgi:cellulose biosynthesis protein BcsQ
MARDGRIRRLKLRGGVRYPADEVLRIERGDERTVETVEPVAVGQGTSGTVAYEVTGAEARVSGAAVAASAATLTVTGAMLTGPTTAPPKRTRTGKARSATAVGMSIGAVMPIGVVSSKDAQSSARPTLPPVVERSWYTVCVAHRKGGVAKSTTTWYLARELARAGKRVVLRDLDPQQGLRDILRDHGCEDGRYSQTIALVPDGEPLPFTPDVELIDTPPALDDSLPGVARADAVIVPAMPEHQAVRALERMLLVLEQTHHEHPFTRVLGLLPVRVKSRWSEHAAFLQQIELLGERFGHRVLPSIPESRAVLTYSLRGRLWRPVAEVVLADLERHRAMRAPGDVRSGVTALTPGGA